MTREMKSSRVHRESSSFICVHRSTAGAFGAAAATCGRAGTGTGSATTAGAEDGTLFDAGAGTEGLRTGFAGSGLISTGDAGAAAPDAGGELSADEAAAASGWRGARCGVASGGNVDMTLGPRSPSATAGTAGSSWRIFQKTNASSATTTHAAISTAAIPSRLGCDA